MVGSSSGGYAAVLFGSLLHAERVFSFNGYFDLAPETEMEDAARINPLLLSTVRERPGTGAFLPPGPFSACGDPRLYISTPRLFSH